MQPKTHANCEILAIRVMSCASEAVNTGHKVRMPRVPNYLCGNLTLRAHRTHGQVDHARGTSCLRLLSNHVSDYNQIRSCAQRNK